ncbi:MAG TPA: hypothetical protein VH184_15475, partial [Dongiaceae bacterium]|nr:hypothetical protein [Dongiaceae bacterium]
KIFGYLTSPALTILKPKKILMCHRGKGVVTGKNNMSDINVPLEYAKLCVQAANAIAVFSVIQTLAFGYALGREGEIRKGVERNLPRVKIAILIATLFYVVLITGLGLLEYGLIGSQISGWLIAGFAFLPCLLVVGVGGAAYCVITFFR